MSSISFSGRGILSGQLEGGVPLLIGQEKQTIHTAIEGNDQLDTIYVYGYSVRRVLSGFTSQVKCEISVLDSSGTEYILANTTLPGLPCTTPTILLNGSVKNGASRIMARALDGHISIFGWYNRTTISLPPSVHTMIGQMTLGYQILSFNSEDETRVIDPRTPMTFITTSHTTSGRLCKATLGSAAVGTIKYLVMSSKHPQADATQGHCIVVPSSSRFPAGELGQAFGTLTFQDLQTPATM